MKRLIFLMFLVFSMNCCAGNWIETVGIAPYYNEAPWISRLLALEDALRMASLKIGGIFEASHSLKNGVEYQGRSRLNQRLQVNGVRKINCHQGKKIIRCKLEVRLSRNLEYKTPKFEAPKDLITSYDLPSRPKQVIRGKLMLLRGDINIGVYRGIRQWQRFSKRIEVFGVGKDYESALESFKKQARARFINWKKTEEFQGIIESESRLEILRISKNCQGHRQLFERLSKDRMIPCEIKILEDEILILLKKGILNLSTKIIISGTNPKKVRHVLNIKKN